MFERELGEGRGGERMGRDVERERGGGEIERHG